MKYVLALVLLSGCAGLSETALPRASRTLDGAKSFYYAMCEVPPTGKEQVCEDGAKSIDGIGEFYDIINDLFGEDE